MEQEPIQAFVLNTLAALNCRVQRREHVWVAHLPKHMAELFGVGERFHFTFHPEHASANVEYLTRGHRVLDQMMQYARQRGRSCNVIFVGFHWNEIAREAICCNPWKEDEPASSQLRGMVEQLRSLRFDNARQRVVHQRMLYHRQVLFRFRVAFCADEKRELLFSALADPATETIDSMVDISKAIAMPTKWWGKSVVSHRFQVDSFAPAPLSRRKSWLRKEASFQAGEAALRLGNAYVWLRLYRKACEYLEEVMLSEKLRFESEAQTRLEAEKKRLDAYYRDLAAETVDPLRRVFRRIAAAELRMGWGGNADSGEQHLERLREEALRLQNQHKMALEYLEAERERRLEELLERYQVRTEVSLAQVSLIYVPRMTWTLRLSGPSRREVSVMYDMLRERIIEPQCDVCENVLSGAARLSCCGDVVCRQCGTNCPSCDAPINSPTDASEMHSLREVGG